MGNVWKARRESAACSARISDTDAAGNCQLERDSNLYMLGITKSFSGISVLQQVNFTAASGEIHALVGANRVGKSTLIKILSGACQSDSGVIQIGSRQVTIHSPADAKRYGIHCVYQEVDVALVPQLTVAENIMLDDLGMGKRTCWIWPSNLRNKASSVMKLLGLSISPSKHVEECTLAEKQMVLLSRIWMSQAKVVIFDEPTASLSIKESERLFSVMHWLRDQGVVVLFISHRLAEVFQHCDRMSIFRDGNLVHSSRIDEICPKEAIQFMLDKTLEEEDPKQSAVRSEVLLSVERLSNGRKVKDISFELRSGETVAFVGLVGAGKTELARMLGGAVGFSSGQIRMAGKPVKLQSIRDAIKAGIVLVPEERHKHSLFMDEPMQSNPCVPMLSRLCSWGLVSFARERHAAEGIIRQLDIELASTKQKVKDVSVGSQQKVGEWLGTDASIIVLDEPAKGIDIDAKNEIFRTIRQLSNEGKGILYFTCDIYEALMIGDRIVVMYDGEVVRVFNRGEASEEQLLFYASAGSGLQDDDKPCTEPKDSGNDRCLHHAVPTCNCDNGILL